jgi:hypothetical protein
MAFQNWIWGSAPNPSQQRGVPLGAQERSQARSMSVEHGVATEEIYALREQPDVWLRVAAFIRRTLGREVELREVSGFLDPYVSLGDTAYSLIRDEGHGLRELVVLLSAVYRHDWSVLVVDEPELHVHPAMARLWISELQRECTATQRSAFVITHEPTLIRPTSADDLAAIWLFAAGAAPRLISGVIQDPQNDRVTASLAENPELVSQLVFSPRPVLVEGVHDVAALLTSINRTQPSEAAAQTDLVACGGTAGVALWFEIANKLGLDVRAVADLDALFDASVARAMDTRTDVAQRYQQELGLEPPRTSEALKSIQARMHQEKVPADPRSKAEWLAALSGDGHAVTRDKLLGIWRDAGLWLHSQGRLEQVLNIPDKGGKKARQAASIPGPIDAVAGWAVYHLDPRGEVETLLGVEVERIAQNIIRALRLDPQRAFTAPTGATSSVDGLLVDVQPLGEGKHRLVVKAPEEFRGQWLDFARDTAASELLLKDPPAPEVGG